MEVELRVDHPLGTGCLLERSPGEEDDGNLIGYASSGRHIP